MCHYLKFGKSEIFLEQSLNNNSTSLFISIGLSGLTVTRSFRRSS